MKLPQADKTFSSASGRNVLRLVDSGPYMHISIRSDDHSYSFYAEKLQCKSIALALCPELEPPEGSFTWAWAAMTKEEHMERYSGNLGEWVLCRLDDEYQEHWGGVWTNEDITRNKISSTWRIPPPAEPERYEFAEAVKVREKAGKHTELRNRNGDRVIWETSGQGPYKFKIWSDDERTWIPFILHTHHLGDEWEVYG